MMEHKGLQFQECSQQNSIYLKLFTWNHETNTIQQLNGEKIIQNNDYINFHIFSFFFEVIMFSREIHSSYIKYIWTF